MAKAIRQIRKEDPNQEEEQSKAVADILKEIADNREAIMETIGIIKGLHEMRALETVHALLEKRVEVGAIAIQQLNQPTVHHMVKNAMNAVSFLGSIEPNQLQTLLSGVSQGLQRMSEVETTQKKQSFFQMGKMLRKSEIKETMRTMLGFVQGMGEVLIKNRREIH